MHRVDTIDTTDAADTFVRYFSAELGRSELIAEVVEFATFAAA